MGRGARGAPRDALLAESVPATSVGRAFGFQRGMDTAGAVIGPAIALLLIPYVPYSSIFFVSFIPGVVSVIVVLTMVKEIRRSRELKHRSFRSSVTGLPREFKLFLLGVGLFGISNFSNVIFTLRAEEVLQPSLGPLQASEFAVLLYVVLNLVYALTSFPAGHLADRMSKRLLLAAGYIIFALACIASIFESPDVYILIAIFVLAGLQAAIVDTVEGAYAADLIGESHRGSGFGLLQTVNGIGDFTSSTLIGVLLTIVSPWLGFGLMAAIAVTGTTLLLTVTRNRGSPRQGEAAQELST